MKITAFWDIVASSSLMMEAECTSEISVYFNETAWCYIPEGCHPHTQCHEKLKSQIRMIYEILLTLLPFQGDVVHSFIDKVCQKTMYKCCKTVLVLICCPHITFISCSYLIFMFVFWEQLS
jgi:hypothetical protein